MTRAPLRRPGRNDEQDAIDAGVEAAAEAVKGWDERDLLIATTAARVAADNLGQGREVVTNQAETLARKGAMDGASESDDGSSAELLPCPFCGAEAAFGEIGGEGDDAGGQFIQCTDACCGASSALIFPLMDDVRWLLVERWNRRPK
jgi:hypothetical protein